MVKILMPDSYTKTKYVLLNTIGQSILSGEFSNNLEYLDLSSLHNGMYYLTIRCHEGVKNIKIIVKK
jgi:hypothetical protein